jgi:hypothetical protein
MFGVRFTFRISVFVTDITRTGLSIGKSIFCPIYINYYVTCQLHLMRSMARYVISAFGYAMSVPEVLECKFKSALSYHLLCFDL